MSLRPMALLPRGYVASASVLCSRRSLSSPAMQGKVVTVTSGKGGVGKTTTAASFAYGLAELGKKTVVIDFDIGLRNLDIHLGCERRVIFDFVNVLQKECTLSQALIKDKRSPNLHILAASQTKDKNILTVEGVGALFEELKKQFDYIVCDSPAGIESGARHAMYFADEAIICTNPELSSCRDSDKMIGFIASKSHRAEQNRSAVIQRLLVTRYDPERAAKDETLSLEDIGELLGLPLLGVIPESKAVLTSTNLGQPVIASQDRAGEAYKDLVRRFLGEEVPFRFIKQEEKSFFSRLFGAGKGPGGRIVIATWCQRDEGNRPFTPADRKMLDFLYSEWTHPYFISISDYAKLMLGTTKLSDIKTDDWAVQTIPAWRHSIWVGVFDPWPVIRRPLLWWKILRDAVTLERMHQAFTDGLMQYGMCSYADTRNFSF